MEVYPLIGCVFLLCHDIRFGVSALLPESSSTPGELPKQATSFPHQPSGPELTIGIPRLLSSPSSEAPLENFSSVIFDKPPVYRLVNTSVTNSEQPMARLSSLVSIESLENASSLISTQSSANVSSLATEEPILDMSSLAYEQHLWQIKKLKPLVNASSLDSTPLTNVSSLDSSLTLANVSSLSSDPMEQAKSLPNQPLGHEITLALPELLSLGNISVLNSDQPLASVSSLISEKPLANVSSIDSTKLTTNSLSLASKQLLTNVSSLESTQKLANASSLSSRQPRAKTLSLNSPQPLANVSYLATSGNGSSLTSKGSLANVSELAAEAAIANVSSLEQPLDNASSGPQVNVSSSASEEPLTNVLLEQPLGTVSSVAFEKPPPNVSFQAFGQSIANSAESQQSLQPKISEISSTTKQSEIDAPLNSHTSPEYSAFALSQTETLLAPKSPTLNSSQLPGSSSVPKSPLFDLSQADLSSGSVSPVFASRAPKSSVFDVSQALSSDSASPVFDLPQAPEIPVFALSQASKLPVFNVLQAKASSAPISLLLDLSQASETPVFALSQASESPVFALSPAESSSAFEPYAETRSSLVPEPSIFESSLASSALYLSSVPEPTALSYLEDSNQSPRVEPPSLVTTLAPRKFGAPLTPEISSQYPESSPLVSSLVPEISSEETPPFERPIFSLRPLIHGLRNVFPPKFLSAQVSSPQSMLSPISSSSSSSDDSESLLMPLFRSGKRIEDGRFSQLLNELVSYVPDFSKIL